MVKSYIELENPTENDRLKHNQKFSPELITELFEGWEKDYYAVAKQPLWHFINKYKFDIRDDIAIYSVRNKMWMVKSTVTMPRTLDDFITDCQRAGIQLTWRVK